MPEALPAILVLVYPRVYGATRTRGRGPPGPGGLSPCVRGYLDSDCTDEEATRSIPVCTGLPFAAGRSSSAVRVYPRVYGATPTFSAIVPSFWGLSPCVRGYQPHPCGGQRPHGSIPVCTGLPPSCPSCRCRGWVYPRVYGATKAVRTKDSGLQGLSPCVRGYRLYR